MIGKMGRLAAILCEQLPIGFISIHIGKFVETSVENAKDVYTILLMNVVNT